MNKPEENCSSCRFFQAEDHAAQGQLNICRRYPPEVSGWPKVDPQDWCGEFKANQKLSDQQRKEFQQSVAELRTDAEAEYWRKIAEDAG